MVQVVVKRKRLIDLTNAAPKAAPVKPSPPAHYDDCDHPLRSIATSCYDRLRPVKAPLGPLGVILSILWWRQARWEAVPVVNRRDPRAAEWPPRLTQRRAREVPVDPRGRPG
jgi:hypothetical protein